MKSVTTRPRLPAKLRRVFFRPVCPVNTVCAPIFLSGQRTMRNTNKRNIANRYNESFEISISS